MRGAAGHRPRSTSHRRWATSASWAVLAVLVFASACGDSPSGPGPIVQPPPPPVPVPNTAPVVESVTVSASRAEVDSDVTATATVRDAETPVEQLRIEWSATAGTFSGSGTTVRWRAPKGPATPADYRLTLTVTETVTGGSPNVVTASSPVVRVHDSQTEVSDLAMSFLGAFANSGVSPEAAVRDFTDSCRGKQDELEDIRKNREHYDVIGSRYSVRSVSFNAARTTGDVAAPCEFTSRVIKCHPEIPNCTVGMTVFVQGVCALDARYEQSRWWLCESRFQNPTAAMRGFFFGR